VAPSTKMTRTRRPPPSNNARLPPSKRRRCRANAHRIPPVSAGRSTKMTPMECRPLFDRFLSPRKMRRRAVGECAVAANFYLLAMKNESNLNPTAPCLQMHQMHDSNPSSANHPNKHTTHTRKKIARETSNQNAPFLSICDKH